jgi:hypothetical protein
MRPYPTQGTDNSDPEEWQVHSHCRRPVSRIVVRLGGAGTKGPAERRLYRIGKKIPPGMIKMETEEAMEEKKGVKEAG